VTKNDHFRDLLRSAKARGLAPRRVCFDAWYSGQEDLKAVRDCGWAFLTRIRCNRRVNLDRQGNRPIRELPISASGTVVHLGGRAGQGVPDRRHGRGHGALDHQPPSDGRGRAAGIRGGAWGIEEYHRGPKQHTGATRRQARYKRAQRNHIGCALRAFVRLEWHRFTTGVSWFEAKLAIIREAVRGYLAQPAYRLPTPATA
jgi:putative transposase